jgi:hypothetical protein
MSPNLTCLRSLSTRGHGPSLANLGVGVPRFRACIVPSRGRERGSVALMGSGWPNNHQ